jgi:hypothetical protein
MVDARLAVNVVRHDQYSSLATPGVTITRYTEVHIYLVVQYRIVIAKEKNVM